MSDADPLVRLLLDKQQRILELEIALTRALAELDRLRSEVEENRELDRRLAELEGRHE